MNTYKIILPVAVSLSLFAFLGLSCVNADHKEESKQEEAKMTEQGASAFPYNLDAPEKFNMPQNLFEISGIAFQNGDPKKVFAIQDEDGDLFHLALQDKDSKFTKFGAKGDYEDLTIIQNQAIVLKSNGELHTFPLSEINKAEAGQVVKTKDLVPKAEYEGLASEEKTGLVYVLTKQSKADLKDKKTVVYAFKFKAPASFTAAGEFNLSSKEIAKASGDSKLKFKPSALAKNPATGEWYILSSVNKLIVVADENFKVKASYPLKGATFNQPEGIAFDRDQNLYISNEGGTLAAGNVLLFKKKAP